MSSTLKLSDMEFKVRFETDAILIKKGGHETSESQKITAFRCVDDITVFAVEYVKGKVKCIMAWRFTYESILDMQLRFHELIEPDADCHIYIVGGTMETTVGRSFLLDRIRVAMHGREAIKGCETVPGCEAVQGYFTRPNIKVERRGNESQKHGCQYVTAKLEINGKLTDCYHN